MLAQVLFSGLALGSIYGLVALGFAVVFKATEVFNLRRACSRCAAPISPPPRSLFSLAVPAGDPLHGGRRRGARRRDPILLIQPLAGRSMLAVIMVTIALSIVLRAVIEIIYGPQGRTLVTPLPNGVITIGSSAHLGIVSHRGAVSWACMAIFAAFFRFTSVGLLMRATADGHEAAVVSGVNVNAMNRLAWAIGSLLAAIGGLFLGQLQIVSTDLEFDRPARAARGRHRRIAEHSRRGRRRSACRRHRAASGVLHLAEIDRHRDLRFLLLILLARPWGLFGQRELGRV